MYHIFIFISEILSLKKYKDGFGGLLKMTIDLEDHWFRRLNYSKSVELSIL